MALRNVFSERFADFRRNETLFNIFCSPFDCEVDSAPEDFQMELLEMQSSAELIGRYASLPLKDFYKYAVSAKDFPNLEACKKNGVSLWQHVHCRTTFF